MAKVQSRKAVKELTLQINISFEDDLLASEPRRSPELRRLLLTLPRRLRLGETEGQLQDSNGNTVGSFQFGEM